MEPGACRRRTPPLDRSRRRTRSRFFGVKKSGNTFTKVAEKLPPGPDGHWYRRSTPLTVRLFASSHRVAVAHPSCTLRRPLRSLAMLLLPMPLTLPTLEVTTARTSTHSRPPPPSSRDREREPSASCSTRFRCDSNHARDALVLTTLVHHRRMTASLAPTFKPPLRTF